MNIAILIGIANYEAATLSSLPACARDVEAMQELLEATKRFDEIIAFKDAKSETVFGELKKLSENENLNEVFIYFSGHGIADADDFFWATCDFAESSPNTTGIAQSSLFEILRSAKTDNVVIVQDACFSGRELIKGSVSEVVKGLGNILVLSSSLSHETTPSGVALSPYTDMFIEASVFSKLEGNIDYLDVLKKLKDIFRGNENHRPHFAGQSPVEVTFCDDASYLSPLRSKYEAPPDAPEENTEDQQIPSAMEILAKSEELVVPREKAQEVVSLCDQRCASLFEDQSELRNHFTLRTVSHADYYNVTDEEEIVRNIRGSGRWDEFVTAKIVREQVRRPRGLWATAVLDSMYAPEYRDEYVFELNARLDGAHQMFFLEPIQEVLRRHALELVFVPGIFECVVFWRFLVQGLSDWGEFSDQGRRSDWQTQATSWDDLIPLMESTLIPSLFKRASSSVEQTVSNLRKLMDDGA